MKKSFIQTCWHFLLLPLPSLLPNPLLLRAAVRINLTEFQIFMRIIISAVALQICDKSWLVIFRRAYQFPKCIPYFAYITVNKTHLERTETRNCIHYRFAKCRFSYLAASKLVLIGCTIESATNLVRSEFLSFFGSLQEKFFGHASDHPHGNASRFCRVADISQMDDHFQNLQKQVVV